MPDIPSILKQVMDSSTQLSGWALLIGGGTMAIIVSTSYRRPTLLSWRLWYLLFIPGWVYIGYSLHYGNILVGKYLASIMVREDQVAAIASQINDNFADQHACLLKSLIFFGLWLLIYTLHWIFYDNCQTGGTS
jgi:hypothetical protein